MARQDIEEDGAPYNCFIRMIPSTVNMAVATATPCCQRRIHRHCYQNHVHTYNTCGIFREPFAAQEAGAVVGAAALEEEPPRMNADTELREAQRQQAIQDHE